MNKCGGCGKFLSGGAACIKCKVLYHRACVNMTTNQTPKQWLCPACVASAPRKDNNETPVKVQEEEYAGSHSSSPSSPSVHLVGESNNQAQLLLEEMRALRADMNSFRQDFSSFREEIRSEVKDLRTLYEGSTKRIDEFSVRMESQDARLIALESMCNETQELKVEVSILRQELRERDQLALSNDLVISGVTENKGESVHHILGLLMAKIGITMEERDVVDARRVGPGRVDEDGKERPRPIVLRVARRAVREQILREARVRRGITTGDLDLAGTPRPIYINESLSKANRYIFRKARTVCKEHKWSYVWTREGNVLIREADGKKAFRIREEKDLDRIFKC